MSDAFIEQAKNERNVLERLIKGLPFVRGYTDKEMRRNADYRVRQLIAAELDASRNALYNIQNDLMSGGGLAHVDRVDRAVSLVSTLSDKIKTASYGYAGLFDTVGIEEEQLNALHRFDVALLADVAKIETAIATLAQTQRNSDGFASAISNVTNAVNELSAQFDRRGQAIVSPDLLTGHAPTVERMEELNLDTLTLPGGTVESGTVESGAGQSIYSESGYTGSASTGSDYTETTRGNVDMANFEAIETDATELTEPADNGNNVDMSNFELTDDEK